MSNKIVDKGGWYISSIGDTSPEVALVLRKDGGYNFCIIYYNHPEVFYDFVDYEDALDFASVLIQTKKAKEALGNAYDFKSKSWIENATV